MSIVYNGNVGGAKVRAAKFKLSDELWRIDRRDPLYGATEAAIRLLTLAELGTYGHTQAEIAGMPPEESTWA